jgi:UDP-glucose 6-dehydrogenase
VFFGEKYIKVSTENFNDSYSTEIIQTLDQKGRIVVTYAVISDENSEEIYSASVTDFIYDGDKLQKLIVVNDRIGTEGKEVICMNKRYDEQGNLTHLEFADEKGEIVSVVDKMYQYYNTDSK